VNGLPGEPTQISGVADRRPPTDCRRKTEFFAFSPVYRAGQKQNFMKYFIYTRKSTDTEEKQVLSIEAQLAELQEFAAKFSVAERQVWLA